MIDPQTAEGAADVIQADPMISDLMKRLARDFPEHPQERLFEAVAQAQAKARRARRPVLLHTEACRILNQ